MTTAIEFEPLRELLPPEACCLHIAVADQNLEDEHIEHCIGSARRQDHPLCYAIALVLRGMSLEEREIACGYDAVNGEFSFASAPVDRIRELEREVDELKNRLRITTELLEATNG